MLNILSFAGAFQTIGSILVAILVLLATITVHEFGHYIVGKIFKFKINEFAIGMGPCIYKKVKKNGEIFSIRLLPLGGFCAFEGEDQEGVNDKKSASKAVNEPFTDYEPNEKQENTPKNNLSPNAFNNKKPYQRILVLIAGASMNFVFAIIIIMLNFAIYGHFVLQANEIVVSDSINAEYSLQSGDKLLAINDQYLYLTTDISKSLMGKKKGDIVKVDVVDANNKKVTRNVLLLSDADSGDKYSYIQAFNALGVATNTILNTLEGSPFDNGVCLLRVNDANTFAECSRIYDNVSFINALRDKKQGDSIGFWVSTSINDNAEKALITVTLSEEWNSVDLDDIKSVKEYFKIQSFNMYYDVNSVNVHLSFGELLYRPFVYSFKNVGATFEAIGDMIKGDMGIENLSGPIATVAMTSEYVKNGLNYLLEIAGLIGISIGIFNLLPIPALDGARAVFVLIEWVRGKPINRKVEGMIHTIGLFVLLGFAVLVDLLKLFM